MSSLVSHLPLYAGLHQAQMREQTQLSSYLPATSLSVYQGTRPANNQPELHTMRLGKQTKNWKTYIVGKLTVKSGIVTSLRLSAATSSLSQSSSVMDCVRCDEASSSVTTSSSRSCRLLTSVNVSLEHTQCQSVTYLPRVFVDSVQNQQSIGVKASITENKQICF